MADEYKSTDKYCKNCSYARPALPDSWADYECILRLPPWMYNNIDKYEGVRAHDSCSFHTYRGTGNG